ncbi:MAG TPA: DUF1592 domain-containing protein, partial [Polyangiaceae bacterium]|nr:DUF1592 domain-containing protein [Polyangiaceae bacterium]
MKHRAPFSSLTSALPALIAAVTVFAVGCETTIGDNGANGGDDGTSGSAGTSSGAGGSSSGAAGTSGASGSTMTGGTSAGGVGGVGGTSGSTGIACKGTHVTTAKRIVRLTDNQLVNTYVSLFGQPATTTIAMTEEIPPAASRSFPPLAEAGTIMSSDQWLRRDRMAQAAMTYVGANTATLTPCTATPTDATCGQNAVLTFAEKAYRRPLSTDEQDSLRVLWTELTTTNGGSVAEAIRFGYYAVLSAPEFLYRTEYGGDWAAQGELDQYEMANELSYFLTDGPPDPPLLAAAAANQLKDKTVLRTQADRVLATPASRANLEAAMVSYFNIDTMPTSIPPTATPGLTVTGGLTTSMIREGELFLANTLWAGTLGDLVTSRRTWVNSQIAMPIYGVSVASTDPNTFTEIMLPEDRMGLLTLSPFLTSRTRPDGASVVGRGLAVNAALVCSVNPAFPEGNTTVTDAIAAQASWNEKQKADFRADPANGALGCPGCHAQFDAMGLVLEHYDAVGRFRTMDLKGNNIDTAWTTSTLPENFMRDVNGDGTAEMVTVSSPSLLVTEL